MGEQQAQVYRLSGDYNPLHIDPDAAQMVGFEKPILHGLCSLGFSVRMVLASYAQDEPSAFKAVRCRFCGPVLPGETLLVKMWHEGNRIIFTAEVKERSKLALNNAYVELTRPATIPSQAASKL